jgi:hypothetical protein
MKNSAVAMMAAFAMSMTVFTAQAADPTPSNQIQLSADKDVMVWVNTRTGVYHYSGSPWYGKTVHGAYMSEFQAKAEGDRPSANGS